MEGGEMERVVGGGRVQVPGGRDLEGRPLVLLHPASDSTIPKALEYALSVFNGDTRHRGVTLLVDAQTKTWRQTRTLVRDLRELLKEERVNMIVVRPDAFWDKKMDHCHRIQKPGEPMYVALGRLSKYVELTELPQSLGGEKNHDHFAWMQLRLRVERVLRLNSEVQSELERMCRFLEGAKQGCNNGARTMTQTSASYSHTLHLANLLIADGVNLLETYGSDAKETAQDVLDTRVRVEKQIRLAESRLACLHEAWAALHKSIADSKEVSRLEALVKSITQWILESGESLLASQTKVGYDETSAERLRRQHENLQLKCRDTYGQYAECLHQFDESLNVGVSLPEDLIAQRDFMDFVCRSFANRLERRRTVLITSARFFRLVSQYFQETSEVYEKLVMNPELDRLQAAHSTLLRLQESQTYLDDLEMSLVREGEKLSDLLSMPVKDALGREVSVDYEADIVNIRDILDMTRARSELLRDSVELQRVVLQQAIHVYDYEKDARQALVWLQELFDVLTQEHCQVGCTLNEIQKQKHQHQAFQDTAKGTFEYGCQLLNAAVTLRQHSKLGEGDNAELSAQLSQAWDKFNSVANNHLTRLRVTAVLHRNLNQQSKELKGMKNWAESGEDLGRLLRCREKLLTEVGRMLRLARLLKTRLAEPLMEGQMGDNGSAVEAIHKKVSEVTELALQLDEALCWPAGRSLHASPSPDSISPPPPCSPSPDWWRKEDGGSRSEEEFVTASECTCTPPSRSSSFYTASDGQPSPPSPWPPAQEVDGILTTEVKQIQTIKLSPEECSVLKETSTNEIFREVARKSPWDRARVSSPEPWSKDIWSEREDFNPSPSSNKGGRDSDDQACWAKEQLGWREVGSADVRDWDPTIEVSSECVFDIDSCDSSNTGLKVLDIKDQSTVQKVGFNEKSPNSPVSPSWLQGGKQWDTLISNSSQNSQDIPSSTNLLVKTPLEIYSSNTIREGNIHLPNRNETRNLSGLGISDETISSNSFNKTPGANALKENWEPQFGQITNPPRETSTLPLVKHQGERKDFQHENFSESMLNCNGFSSSNSERKELRYDDTRIPVHNAIGNHSQHDTKFSRSISPSFSSHWGKTSAICRSKTNESLGSRIRSPVLPSNRQDNVSKERNKNSECRRRKTMSPSYTRWRHSVRSESDLDSRPGSQNREHSVRQQSKCLLPETSFVRRLEEHVQADSIASSRSDSEEKTGCLDPNSKCQKFTKRAIAAIF